MQKVEIKITPKYGGEENMRFVGLLKVMYEAWCNKNRNELLWTEDGLVITGENLEKLIQEHGVHRLSRISPFDPKKRRHTTLCIVEVTLNGILKEPNLELVRAYILSPYQRAKNYVTQQETKEVDTVLSGQPNLLWT